MTKPEHGRLAGPFVIRASDFFRHSTFHICSAEANPLMCRCDARRTHPERTLEMGLLFSFLDADRAVICQPVLFVELQVRAAGVVGAGSELVPGGLVCLGSVVS